MLTSTAFILVKDAGQTYSFDGVTSISHALSLSVSTDSDAEEDADYLNHARNEPDILTLSVVVSDAHVPVVGWSRQMLTVLCQIKEYRLLCSVYTSLRSYDNMLLSALSVQQDDTCPDGWIGTLTFTHVRMPGSEGPTLDNSSAPVLSGAAAVQDLGDQNSASMQSVLHDAAIV